jgi:preprotein translocase subunit YajC
MKNLTKNQQVIILIIILVFIIGGIFYLTSRPKKKIAALPENKQEEEIKPGFTSLTAAILEVNLGGNYLLVKSVKDEKQLKVRIDKDTEIIQLKFPFDPSHPPEGENFNFEEVPIKIGDLKVDKQVIINTFQDITGKSEFGNISQIKVMP